MFCSEYASGGMITASDLAALGCPETNIHVSLAIWLTSQEFESVSEIRGCRRFLYLDGA